MASFSRLGSATSHRRAPLAAARPEAAGSARRAAAATKAKERGRHRHLARARRRSTVRPKTAAKVSSAQLAAVTRELPRNGSRRTAGRPQGLRREARAPARRSAPACGALLALQNRGGALPGHRPLRRAVARAQPRQPAPNPEQHGRVAIGGAAAPRRWRGTPTCRASSSASARSTTSRSCSAAAAIGDGAAAAARMLLSQRVFCSTTGARRRASCRRRRPPPRPPPAAAAVSAAPTTTVPSSRRRRSARCRARRGCGCARRRSRGATRRPSSR